jgi:hypothetical protein
MEATDYCEINLHKLMMPCIILSTGATVFSSFLSCNFWGSIVISSINAIIAFLLALINYFKLDAASQAHKISAHQYDKLQTSVEFMSAKVSLNSFTLGRDSHPNLMFLFCVLLKKILFSFSSFILFAEFCNSLSTIFIAAICSRTV